MTQLDRYIRVIGIDPGLAHFGWSVVDLYSDRERFVSCGCIRTDKSEKARKVKVADDNVRRARYLAVELAKVLDKYKPTHATSEAFSSPRSSSAAAKAAFSFGVLITSITSRRMGLSTATPKEIKRAVTGSVSATKKQVQAALFEREGYGRIEDVLTRLADRKQTLPTLPRGKWEHPCDATGSVIACLDSEIIISLRGQL